ncbi:UHRF2 ligase, partial [Acromyrmex insinuator]
MAKSGSDVSRTVCANTIQENERRLREARIKNQGKGRIRHDLNKLFSKLNQAVEASSLKSVDKSSPSYNKNVSRCWYGPVLGFPPGSWWGIRMDCSRDKMHEPFNVDIHEGPFGVISVCTSHTNVNEDVDLGDYLTLTGQVYHKEQPSVDPFIRNYKNQIPLRLIRSYNLQDNIAPNTGYRYDGLYVVISCWIGMALDGTKYNKFALMRLANQESPSWSSKGSEELSSVRHCIPLSKSNHLNTYDLRKCSNNIGVTCRKRKLSYGDSRESLPVAKTLPLVDTSRRSAPESSIVTRHVFKKLPSNTESAISTSVPDQKMLLCLGSSIDITIRTALDMEGNHLTPKEDAKPIEKPSVDKARVNSRSSENVSYNGYVVADNTNTSLLNKCRENLSSIVVNSSEHSYCISSSLDSSKNSANTTIEHKEQFQNAQRRDVQNLNTDNEPTQKSNSRNESPRNSVATYERISECHDASEIPSESFCAQNIKSLDSLTPDKILNLINKEIHHPMSKLLIGNVIGLTTEECAMWNASKRETTPETKSKKYVPTNINLRKKRKETDNIKENVACLDNRRYCKYSKSERLFWKVTKQADGEKFDNLLPSMDCQSCNDADQKCNNNIRRSDRNCISKKNNEYLSPFRVKSSLQTIAQHTRSSYDIKTRLRTDKKAVLVKPKFPDSSIKKTKYKKRDREIANLSIDANFGPMTRGPRNRRLRCKNNAYLNYCNTFNTVIYSSNKRYKSSFKRKSKLTKVNRVGERQTKNKYRLTNTVHANSKNINSSIEKQKTLRNNLSNDNNENHNNHNNNNVSNKKKEDETVTADHAITRTSFDRSLRNKLTRTIPLSHRTAQPRLHCFRKKQEKPSTMDATTHKVTKRDVAEEYHKYANNEDTNAVVYMDDELQYQDIEEEEEDDEKQLIASTSLKSTLRGIQLKTGNILPETLTSRENLESPWHGWKKIVTNNQSYWIGW